MYRQTANEFYKSRSWRNLRRAYYKQAGGLCERCYANGLVVPGEIVHHKIHLNADNINDESISLNTDNLELVCRKCHAELHPELGTKRYKVDEYGNITSK